MSYSKALYQVDNTGETIEHRFSFDMIINSMNNKKIVQEKKKCRMCEVNFCAKWCINYEGKI